jgi:hypothetical protein
LIFKGGFATIGPWIGQGRKTMKYMRKSILPVGASTTAGKFPGTCPKAWLAEGKKLAKDGHIA